LKLGQETLAIMKIAVSVQRYWYLYG
jgi:hypothetical protein